MVAEMMQIASVARGKKCTLVIDKKELIDNGNDLEAVELSFKEETAGSGVIGVFRLRILMRVFCGTSKALPLGDNSMVCDGKIDRIRPGSTLTRSRRRVSCRPIATPVA
jgi:hypothetical protein